MASLTLDQLNPLLTEARTALHSLQIGKAIALVRDQNGEEIRYTQANRADLAAYVRQLEDEIAKLTDPCTTQTGPMRLWF